MDFIGICDRRSQLCELDFTIMHDVLRKSYMYNGVVSARTDSLNLFRTRVKDACPSS